MTNTIETITTTISWIIIIVIIVLLVKFAIKCTDEIEQRYGEDGVSQGFGWLVLIFSIVFFTAIGDDLETFLQMSIPTLILGTIVFFSYRKRRKMYGTKLAIGSTLASIFAVVLQILAICIITEGVKTIKEHNDKNS